MLDSQFQYTRVKTLVWNALKTKAETSDYLENCDPLEIIAETWKIGSPVPNFLLTKKTCETYRRVIAYLDRKRLGQAVIALASACQVPILNAEFTPFYHHPSEDTLGPVIRTYFFSLSDLHLTLEAYGLTAPFPEFSREPMTIHQSSMMQFRIMKQLNTEEWAPFFSDFRECRVYERVLRHNVLELDKDKIFKRFNLACH
jgi:hypothetical protein